MQLGCLGAAIVFIAIAFALIFIQDNPWVIYVIAIVIVALIGAFQLYKKKQNNKTIEELYALRPLLQKFTRGFEPITDLYISLRPKEFAFYERNNVSLYEYKSSGSTMSGGFLGGSLGITDNIAITGGGFEGQSTPNPEVATEIDNGRVIFTNQRVAFVGSNHTREFDFEKLLNLDIAPNGFIVKVSVSGQPKTSALRADASGGLTPGFAFGIAAALYQHGEEEAKALASQVLRDIETQYRALVAGKTS